jgi:enoyl-CoA hydratase/carnithine racemase
MKLSTDKIIAGSEGGVGTLVFNNPEKRNALSLEMWAGIDEAMTAFEDDASVRVIVLRGAGGKAFISGADISQFEERRSTVEKAGDYNAATGKAWNALARSSKPVVAAIEGFCIGGGLAVAMKADIRVATRESQFGVPAARLGLAYGEHSIRDLVNLVGPSDAKWILFTGRQVDAETALRIGLVNEVVEAGQLSAAVARLCATLSENAPLSIRASKETVDQIAAGRVDRARLKALETQCIESTDFAEGRKAFMEKRKPRFSGK